MDFDDKKVEAIEEGQIVRVSESYAIREGLPIIKRPQYRIGDRVIMQDKKAPIEKEKPKLSLSSFRKPLDWQKNRVIKELLPNFHWEILKRRKAMNINRRQLAEAVGEREETIKLLENGMLDKDDFILINKIQNYMGINLRRDNANFGQEMRKLVETKPINLDHEFRPNVNKPSDKTHKEKALEKDVESLLGDDISLVE